MVKIKLYETEFLKPAVDCAVGDILQILDEAKPSGKFGAPTCLVQLPNGEKKTLSMNRTTTKSLLAKHGSASEKWVGAKLRYLGEVQCGAMVGRVFEAI